MELITEKNLQLQWIRDQFNGVKVLRAGDENWDRLEELAITLRFIVSDHGEFRDVLIPILRSCFNDNPQLMHVQLSLSGNRIKELKDSHEYPILISIQNSLRAARREVQAYTATQTENEIVFSDPAAILNRLSEFSFADAVEGQWELMIKYFHAFRIAAALDFYKYRNQLVGIVANSFRSDVGKIKKAKLDLENKVSDPEVDPAYMHNTYKEMLKVVSEVYRIASNRLAKSRYSEFTREAPHDDDAVIGEQ